jgi:hypothetical protein
MVYLIGGSESALSKIGRSTDVQRRLALIQSMSPVGLELLWVAEGGKELENALHRELRDHRRHGEWFDLGTPAQAVERVAAAAKVGTPIDAKRIADLTKAVQEAKCARDAARKALRLAIANELKDPTRVRLKDGTFTTPTNKQVADVLPWSEETVRGIAREYGVTPKRKPTVKSIKPARRAKPRG